LFNNPSDIRQALLRQKNRNVADFDQQADPHRFDRG